MRYIYTVYAGEDRQLRLNRYCRFPSGELKRENCALCITDDEAPEGFWFLLSAHDDNEKLATLTETAFFHFFKIIKENHAE